MSHPFIPAPNTVRIELVWNFQGRICENIVHVLCGVEVTSDVLSTLGLQARDWMQDTWASIGSIHAGMEKVIATDISVAGGLFYETTEFTNLNGDVGGTAMPLNVSLAVSHSTGYAGRSRRGRNYLVGLPLEAIQSATPSYCTVEYQLNVKAAWEELMAVLSAKSEGGYAAVVSYRGDNAWRDEALITPITGIVVNRRLDTMRRRLPA